MTALEDIVAERQRQISVEGWTPEHDDEHDEGELMRAGMVYLHYSTEYQNATGWPWEPEWFKPKDRRSNLIRAGALFMAEKDRKKRLGDSNVSYIDHKLNLAVQYLEELEPKE